ncbi:MAG: hypothetical protein A2057_17125 [Ignavibacteria bacterium GWA2_35_9]|nr:MAG: hypothetical protein A2057_17125 [Ignavibacteria bacterium GWA2_35_9]OGU43245.1 MAG: hypothetical protein A2000_08605 [Ignavibacteria bacterium GWB2_36_8]OGU49861.1 MAG: hypothetical protein A2080_05430 [Ignavibacteria bacterium GWC2_36_12]
MKRFVSLKDVIITSVIFIFMLGLSFIPVNCKFLSPIATALGDFDVYDIAYSKLLETQPVDTNIVLVNIGNLDRGELADLISVLNKCQPAVVGIDVFFNVEKDPASDSLLSSSLAGCRSLVMVSKLDQYDEETKNYRNLHLSIPLFSRYAETGFANLPNDDEESFRTIRDFRPTAKNNHSTVPAFAVKIAGFYKPASLHTLFERQKELEKINFRGNYNCFYFIDTYQYFEPEADFSFIKNKIVLLGYMGPDLNTKSLEDIFFTPLNERYAGKSFPDMYGVVVHANIVSMIINGSFVNVMPSWLSSLLAVIITFFNVKVLLYLKSRYKDWFSGLTKIFILIYTILNLFLSVEILHYLNYRISLTTAMIAIVLTNTSIEFYHNYLIKLQNKITKLVRKNEND